MDATAPVRNDGGGYCYLPSIAAYSSGVVADERHEIVRVELEQYVTVEDLPGWVVDIVERRCGRPRAALCAVELRSPEQISFDEFAVFNEHYSGMLESLGIMVDGVNPVARTNVVPLIEPPSEPSVYAVAFTVPRRPGSPDSYVLAGVGDTLGLSESQIVRGRDGTADPLAEKAASVLHRLTENQRRLQRGRSMPGTAHVYTAHVLSTDLCATIGRAVGALDGSFQLHPARPPIEGLEFEMDLRSVTRTMAA